MVQFKYSVWLGCTTRTYLKGTIDSLDKIMGHLDLKYHIIEYKKTSRDIAHELCCGSVLFNTGQRQKAMANLKVVEEVLKAQKVRDLVALCPGCTRTFLEFYLPRRSNPIERVEHISEMFLEHMDEFKFKPKHVRKITRATYHDPCHLGRHMGIYEPPREVLHALPGVELVEMPTTREDSYCCGSGGGVRAYNRELANTTSQMRVREALELDVEYLVTACPFCERSLINGVELEKAKKDLKVINLVDFVASYIK
jgi:Fe-S oxidoreductase